MERSDAGTFLTCVNILPERSRLGLKRTFFAMNNVGLSLSHTSGNVQYKLGYCAVTLNAGLDMVASPSVDAWL